MSDNISRQAVLEWLKTEWDGMITSVFDGIEQLPSVDEWTLCSERLPKEHEWVGTKMFGTTISDNVHITFDVNGKRFVRTMSLQNGKLSDSDKKTMDVFHKGWKMIAWMPLPEPYQERS